MRYAITMLATLAILGGGMAAQANPVKHGLQKTDNGIKKGVSVPVNGVKKGWRTKKGWHSTTHTVKKVF
jgi:hypothetical protein